MKNRLSYFCPRSIIIGIGLSYMLSLNGASLLLVMIISFAINYFLIDKINTQSSSILILSFLIYLSVITCNLCHTLYLENTSLLLIVLFTLFIPFMISFIKRESFVKLSDNLFKCSLLIFTLTTISLIPYIDLNNLKPIEMPNITNMLKGIVLFSTSNLLPSLLINEKDKKHILISNTTILILTFLIITVLGLKESIFYRYPEYVVLKRVKFLNFISNVDNIFFFIILVDLIIVMSLCFNKLIKNNKIYNIILFATTVLTTYLLTSSGKVLNGLYNLFPYYILISFIMTILFKKRKYK